MLLEHPSTLSCLRRPFNFKEFKTTLDNGLCSLLYFASIQETPGHSNFDDLSVLQFQFHRWKFDNMKDFEWIALIGCFGFWPTLLMNRLSILFLLVDHMVWK